MLLFSFKFHLLLSFEEILNKKIKWNFWDQLDCLKLSFFLLLSLQSTQDYFRIFYLHKSSVNFPQWKDANLFLRLIIILLFVFRTYFLNVSKVQWSWRLLRNIFSTNLKYKRVRYLIWIFSYLLFTYRLILS